jgi:UDP-glucose 4-epimerase
MTREVLVTGGAGYIGSHMCVELLQAGYEVVVVDNLSNSKRSSLDAIQRITNCPVTFVQADLRDRAALEALFDDYQFAAVLHFAGLKAVGESVAHPTLYYDNNVGGTLNLIDIMNLKGPKTMVFSSSATVYGFPDQLPIRECAPTNPINPYGRTKLMIEQILADLCKSDETWRISALRYFNPVGAHPSGEIGEDPNETPNNLMPYIAQVAVGRREVLSVHGNDYPTHDGTGVRDYIHVVDLVRGHLRALEYLNRSTGFSVHNLGTGRGYSVLEVVEAFRTVSQCTIPTRFVDRRPGDAAASYADPGLARGDLKWVAEHSLEDMCRDAWKWQSSHPLGYEP